MQLVGMYMHALLSVVCAGVSVCRTFFLNYRVHSFCCPLLTSAQGHLRQIILLYIASYSYALVARLGDLFG